MSLSDVDLWGIGSDPAAVLRSIERYEAEQSLYAFVKLMWRTVEPSREFIGSWVLRAICEHLEAVTEGRLTRLSINVFPGATKSLLTSVFWPAWEWGPRGLGHQRYVGFSYAAHLTERDNRRFKQVILSRLYQDYWGDRFRLINESVGLIINDKSGWKLASSIGGVGTGERGDRVIIDDGNRPPTDTDLGDSAQVMKTTATWFREVLPDRLNSLRESAIVNIQQRISELDISGIILELGLPYCHLCIPMTLDSLPDAAGRVRPIIPTDIGWVDPRYRMDWQQVEEDPDYDAYGELAEEAEIQARDGTPADPVRFPVAQLQELQLAKGAYAWSCQYQQLVVPRGGGIIKEEYWRFWDGEEMPEYGTCIASLDTAYSERETADWNALTVWTAFKHPADERPKVMLADAWRMRGGLTELARRLIKTCRPGKPEEGPTVEILLIEDKNRAKDLRDEIYRLMNSRHQLRVLLMPVKGDKTQRMNAVEPLFTNGVVWTVEREWSDVVIREMATFPSGRWDDFCFVAGTKIATKRGPVPIEAVGLADEVLTPIGWRRVTAAGFTGVKPVVKRGRLEGTVDHPVFDIARGYCLLHSINSSSRLSELKLCDLIRLTLPKQWNLWASSTDAWGANEGTIFPRRLETKAVKIPRAYMWQSGSISLGKRFRLSMKCITEIMTRSILILKIWSAYRGASIVGTLKTTIWRSRESILRECVRWLLNGTNPKLAGLGIVNMSPKVWINAGKLQNKCGEKNPATGAGVLSRSNSRAADGAAPNARYSTPRGSEANKSSSIPTLQPVYNLTVEGAHCYYANSVLVHNCDSASQALMYMRETGVAVRSQEYDDDMRELRRYRKKMAPAYDV